MLWLSNECPAIEVQPRKLLLCSKVCIIFYHHGSSLSGLKIKGHVQEEGANLREWSRDRLDSCWQLFRYGFGIDSGT